MTRPRRSAADHPGVSIRQSRAGRLQDSLHRSGVLVPFAQGRWQQGRGYVFAVAIVVADY
jgi:hypothetical protein